MIKNATRMDFEKAMNDNDFGYDHTYEGWEDMIEGEWSRDDDYMFFIHEHYNGGVFGGQLKIQFYNHEPSFLFLVSNDKQCLIDRMEIDGKYVRIYMEDDSVYTIHLFREVSVYNQHPIFEVD